MTWTTEPGGESSATEAPVFATGDLVAGTYEIKALLGAGGMGEVY